MGERAALERNWVLYKQPFVTYYFHRISECPRTLESLGGERELHIGEGPKEVMRGGEGTAPTRWPGGRGGIEAEAESQRPQGRGCRKGPEAGAGAPLSCQATARRPRGHQNTQDTEGFRMRRSTRPGRVSRIFHRGQPTGGIGARLRLRPRPWKRRVEKGWCIREAKSHHFARRSAARSDREEGRRSDRLLQEAATAAAAAQLRSAGAAAALGTPAREGVRAGRRGGAAGPAPAG